MFDSVAARPYHAEMRIEENESINKSEWTSDMGE